MEEYRRGAHAVYDIKYHLIWITKYRYKVLRGRVAERARDLIRQSCQARDVVVVRGAVSPDHVHMLVSVPPQMAPSKLVQYLKGRSSRRLQDEFEGLRKRYWGQHLWARGYFCATVGAVLGARFDHCVDNPDDAAFTRRTDWIRRNEAESAVFGGVVVEPKAFKAPVIFDRLERQG